MMESDRPTDSSVIEQVFTPSAEEAVRLFQGIFRRDPPPGFIDWFIRTPPSVFPPFDRQTWTAYQKVIREVGDLEALEFASRLLGRNRLLTCKMQLVIYLAECCPELRRHFVNRRDLPLAVAFLQLTGTKLYNFWKLIKGIILLVKHHGP